MGHHSNNGESAHNSHLNTLLTGCFITNGLICVNVALNCFCLINSSFSHSYLTSSGVTFAMVFSEGKQMRGGDKDLQLHRHLT